MERIKNKKVIIIIAVVLVVLIIGTIIGFKTYNYLKSNKYKLKKLGYNEKEISTVLKMDKEKLETILSLEYNEHIIPLFQEKYFILTNLNKYLNYKSKIKFI